MKAEDSARFPLVLAVLASILLVSSCFSPDPEAPVAAPNLLAVEANVLYMSHEANLAVLAQTSERYLYVVTEDFTLQVLHFKESESSPSTLLGAIPILRETRVRFPVQPQLLTVIPSNMARHDEEMVCLAMSNGLLAAFTFLGKHQVWRREWELALPAKLHSVRSERDAIYLYLQTNVLIRLDAHSGEIVWELALGGALVDFCPQCGLFRGNLVRLASQAIVRVDLEAGRVLLLLLEEEEEDGLLAIVRFRNETSPARRYFGASRLAPASKVASKTQRVMITSSAKTSSVVCSKQLDDADDGKWEVVWQRALRGVHVMRLLSPTNNRHLVAASAEEGIVALHIRDGTMAAPHPATVALPLRHIADMPEHDAEAENSALFVLVVDAKGLVQRVALTLRSNTPKLPPLSLIPVTLLLVVVWAAVFYSHVDTDDYDKTK